MLFPITLFYFNTDNSRLPESESVCEPPRPSSGLLSLLQACFPSQAAEFLLLDADVAEIRSGCFSLHRAVEDAVCSPH